MDPRNKTSWSFVGGMLHYACAFVINFDSWPLDGYFGCVLGLRWVVGGWIFGVKLWWVG